MNEELSEAVGDLGMPAEAPLAKLGKSEPLEPPISKLGHAAPPDAEQEQEDFDAREYVTHQPGLGETLKTLGFEVNTKARQGVVAYVLKHVPLPSPIVFHAADTEEVKRVEWANVHVRYDPTAAIPFWRVLMAPGHETAYYSDLQQFKLKRLEPDEAGSNSWVPDALDAVEEVLKLVSTPCYKSLTIFINRFTKAGYREFK